MTATPPGPAPTASPPRLLVLTSAGLAPPYNAGRLAELARVEYVQAPDLAAALPGAEALVAWDFASPALRDAWSAADALRWVHVAAAGVDAVLFAELAASEVTLTNAHGVFDQPIAEYVLAAVLADDKQVLESAELQRARVWRHRETRRTAGRTALVVGTGGIGRAIARLLRAVGLRVTGAGRVARRNDPDFGDVVASAGLVDCLGDFDVVILVAPLTAQTRGLLGAAELAAMRPDAHLINVGRGALIDEDALVDTLRAGRLRRASLDVFAVEPLPVEHPLWGLEQVRISAHLSGDTAGWRDDLADQIADNLRRWIAGEAMINVVDKAVGYVRRAESTEGAA